MATDSASRPNILVVLTDDHGQWAAGCYGNRELRTPSMDYLAATGARFANAFTPTPVCSPARAAFFTGRLPCQHGIHDYIQEQGSPDTDWMAGETTVAELLRDGGYQTALVGKWHCGRSWMPQGGFDYWFSYQRAQYPHRGTQLFVEQGTPVTCDGFQSTFITAKAIEFLRRRDRSKPFFLFAGYVDTHSPFSDHPERLVASYRRATFADVPRETADAERGWVRFAPPSDEAQRRERLAQYYGAVSMVDEQLGALLDELEGTGELDRTLVVYTADHGHMNGQHGLYTKGNATVPQNFYEESIRVPLLVRWPGAIEARQVRQEMVDHCDLFQTVLDAAGSRPAPAMADERRYPGQSFLPLISGGDQGWRQEQYGEYGNARMLRTSRYKLVRHYVPHADVYPDEFYNLEADPRETRNLIADPAQAALIADLGDRLEAHFAYYEQPERSARTILSQPVFNPYEPWRIQRPE